MLLKLAATLAYAGARGGCAWALTEGGRTEGNYFGKRGGRGMMGRSGHPAVGFQGLVYEGIIHRKELCTPNTDQGLGGRAGDPRVLLLGSDIK